MDRNTITGFALLALLVITYFWYNNYSQKQYEIKKQADSITYAKAHPAPLIDSARIKAAAAAPVDKVNDSVQATLAPALRSTPAEMVTLENKNVAIQFS